LEENDRLVIRDTSYLLTIKSNDADEWSQWTYLGHF